MLQSFRFDNKVKLQEKAILEQGIHLRPAPMVSKKPIPAALGRAPSIPVPPPATPRQLEFDMPVNTIGQANFRKKRVQSPEKAISTSSQAILIIQQPEPQPANTTSSPEPQPVRQQLILPANSTIVPPTGFVIPSAVMPSFSGTSRATKYRHKRKLEQDQLKGIESGKTRKYTKSANPTQCHKCNQERDKEMHKMYYGKVWCRRTSEYTYEEWLADINKKK